MIEKTFQTHDELIDLLIQRGVHISSDSDKSFAKQILDKVGYYNLINGYNKLFLLDEPQENGFLYKPNTTIKEIYALFKFDKKLREIFFKYILQIETTVKNLIAYSFSQVHGHKNYLVYTNFNKSLRNSETNITNLIAEIQRQTATKCKDPSISHYLKNHGYIPLWVLNNILTLGTISKFYSLMLPKERQYVSKQFSLLDNELEISLFYISTIRNFCAHGNRLYCFRTKMPLIDTKYHSGLDINKTSKGEFELGKRDLFACVIALKQLLPSNDYKKFNKEIYRAMGNLRRQLHVLNLEDIQKEMGFPQNWRYLADL